MLPPPFLPFAGRIGRATERWRGPVAAGLIAAAALWAVWYFTKVPCTIESAAAGKCNPGLLARYINHQIMAQCLLVGMAAATLKGGYNEIMLNRERKRADAAEERLAEERKRMDELYAEIRAELQQSRAERQQNLAERQQNLAVQQAMMDTLAQMNSTLAQLLQQRQNGNEHSTPEN